MIYEQIALNYLNAKKPFLRKYAFYLTLACRRYLDAALVSFILQILIFNAEFDQYEHAARCGQAAMHIYEQKGWSFIEEDLRYVLGQHAFETGKFMRAFELIAGIISSSSFRPDLQLQQKYLVSLRKSFNVCIYFR
jgi:hypothetical protein